jgi:hypothetical protein
MRGFALDDSSETWQPDRTTGRSGATPGWKPDTESRDKPHFPGQQITTRQLAITSPTRMTLIESIHFSND